MKDRLFRFDDLILSAHLDNVIIECGYALGIAGEAYRARGADVGA